MNELFIGSLITAFGVILGAFLQYFFQNKVNKKEKQKISKESLIISINRLEAVFEQLQEFVGMEESEVKKLWNTPLMFSHYNQLFQSFSKFLSSYGIYNLYAKKELDYNKRIEKLQDELLSGFAYALGDPSLEGRKEFKKAINNYKKFLDELKKKIIEESLR